MRLAGVMLATVFICGISVKCVDAFSDNHADEVRELPGWPHALSSRQWSGMLSLPRRPGLAEMHVHYWLVESEQNATVDPLLVWFNGGESYNSS